jgi:hypothetical protein
MEEGASGRRDDEPGDPMFFSLLDDEDQKKYVELRTLLHSSDKRYKRYKRIEALQDALDLIRDFCVRGNDSDWRRCLVCGVCWIGQDIAINTRQLRVLIDKCKSSINGALNKMGYGTAPVKSAIAASLLAYIPFLKGNFVEQRQWTVRRKLQLSPMPMRSGFPTPFIFRHGMGSAFATPEFHRPVVPEIEEEDILNEFKAIFGVDDVNPDDAGYNFITDTCCCCPLEWARNEHDLDEFFKFA